MFKFERKLRSMLLAISGLTLLSLSPWPGHTPSPAVAASPGVELVQEINAPQTGQAPFPLLIIAPAKKYAMDGPIFEDLARRAANLGYFVVRFNWPFYTQNSAPSPQLKSESQALKALIREYRERPDIDPDRLVLAAKSFGSQVLMKGAWKEASALLLLTPNCSEAHPFSRLYQPLFSYRKPLHIVISKDDPYCDVQQIYLAMPQFKANTTLYTLGGDHNFALMEAPTDKNLQAALLSSENWLSQQL